MPKKTETETKRPVLITTDRRGVFFGRLRSYAEKTAVLEDARMAIYWGTTGGVLQLAATGPTAKSRIGSKVPAITLEGVTSVIECAEGAVKAWDAL